VVRSNYESADGRAFEYTAETVLRDAGTRFAVLRSETRICRQWRTNHVDGSSSEIRPAPYTLRSPVSWPADQWIGRLRIEAAASGCLVRRGHAEFTLNVGS